MAWLNAPNTAESGLFTQAHDALNMALEELERAKAAAPKAGDGKWKGADKRKFRESLTKTRTFVRAAQRNLIKAEDAIEPEERREFLTRLVESLNRARVELKKSIGRIVRKLELPSPT